MSSFYFPFALTVGGMLLYHVSQKSIPKEINPFVATIVAYAAGIVICLIGALAFSGRKSFIDSARASNWAVFAVGAGAVLIEIGFMLTYRAGWRISITAVASNAAATALLVPLGVLVFKDHLSIRNVVGLLFCVLGLVLVMKRS